MCWSMKAHGAHAALVSGGFTAFTAKVAKGLGFDENRANTLLIENGKLGAPVKGATLIGNGPDVLTRVSMVGNDLALDQGVGTCGKEGQSVPVGVGQPTLRVDGVTIGGSRVA